MLSADSNDEHRSEPAVNRKSDILAIEKIQKRATKLVITLKKLSYKDRLMQLNLHTLKYRRLTHTERTYMQHIKNNIYVGIYIR